MGHKRMALNMIGNRSTTLSAISVAFALFNATASSAAISESMPPHATSPNAKAPSVAPDATQVEPVAAPFAIAPYLFAHPTEGLTLAWAYREPGTVVGADFDAVQLEAAPRVSEATFQDARGRTHVLAADMKRGIYHAHPPVSCSTEPWTLHVTGMKEPVPMQLVPCAGDPSVSFSFLTDTQQDLEQVSALIQQMAKRDDAFTLHGGDIVNMGDNEEEWLGLLAALQPLTKSRPLVAASGNHDFFFDQEGKNLDRYLGLKASQSYYRFRSGPVLVVILNSTHITNPDFNQKQLAFLDETLKEDAPWKLVLFHHAVYSESFAHGEMATFVRDEHLTLRREYEPIFQQRGVNVVVTGHVHLLERSYKDDVHYLVGGPAGGFMGIGGTENPFSKLSLQVRSATSFEATEDQLRLTSYDKDGVEHDTLVIKRRHMPPAVATTQ